MFFSRCRFRTQPGLVSMAAASTLSKARMVTFCLLRFLFGVVCVAPQLGLNGSGKSSLMRVMAGQLAPAAGEVATPSSSRLQVGGWAQRLTQGRWGAHNRRQAILLNAYAYAA